MAQSVRDVLPMRRPSEQIEFEFGGHIYVATVGRAEYGGLVSEVFLNGSKCGSDVDMLARDAATAISIALQYGTPLAALRHAMGRNKDGSPSSPIGKLLTTLKSKEANK